jgi:hypothetical protein
LGLAFLRKNHSFRWRCNFKEVGFSNLLHVSHKCACCQHFWSSGVPNDDMTWVQQLPYEAFSVCKVAKASWAFGQWCK